MRLKIALISALMLAVMTVDLAIADVQKESLLVFVQPDVSDVDRFFQENTLPEIRIIVDKMNVPLSVIDASKGAPAQVGITPMIVYQNHKGRAVYQGRTLTLERVRGFIRTFRFVPQGTEPMVRKNIPIWHMGRAKVASPIKITELAGEKGEGYDHSEFVAEARGYIERGFKNYKIQERAELTRSDRLFYMDFYPYRSKEGRFYLSVALYSQFHCEIPVFTRMAAPFEGNWEERGDVFTKAAAALELAVSENIASAENGDGFDLLKKDVPVVSFEELGFKLPPAPVRKADTTVDIEIPLKWITEEPGPDGPPTVQFRFPSPLDQYFGETSKAKGEFRMKSKNTLENGKGRIEVDPKTISMGIKGLNKVIQLPSHLHSAKFPKSYFVIDKINADGERLAFGRLTRAEVSGLFTMKGVSVPISFVAEVEPVVAQDGRPRLLAHGAYEINLKDFGIKGADGPKPQKHTILFNINLRLKPAD